MTPEDLAQMLSETRPLIIALHRTIAETLLARLRSGEDVKASLLSVAATFCKDNGVTLAPTKKAASAEAAKKALEAMAEADFEDLPFSDLDDNVVRFDAAARRDPF